VQGGEEIAVVTEGLNSSHNHVSKLRGQVSCVRCYKEAKAELPRREQGYRFLLPFFEPEIQKTARCD